MSDKNGFGWLNVLLVDDSQAILEYVSTVLSELYKIENTYSAASVKEAMQVFRQSNSINLIFLDLNMPNEDGIQLLEQLKNHQYSGYVVIMSGVSTRIISSVEQLAQKYGLNYIGTLLKPIHETDFASIIERVGQSYSKRECTESLKTYEIVRAIKNNDFEVLYQPQIDLNTRSFFGVEALCRMKHPRLGIVSPDRFIGKAEESELIIHITLAVYKQAFVDWKKWRRLGLDIKLSLNASPISLQQPEFADFIFGLLDSHQMQASRLCIEVTESVLASDQPQELMNLSRLSMRGVDIALDDFGQENSTIERMQKLPLTYLKLDKSYFLDNPESLNRMSLINSTLSLANELKLTTIAEGVENAEILSLVTKLGCDTAQGYHIGRPMAASKILSWERDWNNLT